MMEIARCHAKLGDKDMALKVYFQISKKYGNLQEEDMSESFKMMSNFEPMYSQEPGIALYQNMLTACHFEIGMIYYKKKDYATALENFNIFTNL